MVLTHTFIMMAYHMFLNAVDASVALPEYSLTMVMYAIFGLYLMESN